MDFNTRTPKLTDNNGEYAGLVRIDPEYIIVEEDRRALMHDPRVIKIADELEPTATPKDFMDAVRIFSDEFDAIRLAAAAEGFDKDEARDVAVAVKAMRRERTFGLYDINPRLNYLAGDPEVFRIARELNVIGFNFGDGVEAMVNRLRELHVHEDDIAGLVDAIKRRVAISDQYQTGLAVAE